ncbi:Uncharacterized protein Fot_11255 [Forsythia ovata]|uniref:Uncharacterized protein n=1 Tax=Forsythia ovata TaxID=205694 RepID=A0ABD1WMX1_9LAMI
MKTYTFSEKDSLDISHRRRFSDSDLRNPSRRTTDQENISTHRANANLCTRFSKYMNRRQHYKGATIATNRTGASEDLHDWCRIDCKGAAVARSISPRYLWIYKTAIGCSSVCSVS